MAWLQHRRLSKRTEARSHFSREEFRLFPGGEVPTLLDLVVVDEVGIRLLGPAARRAVDLFGEHADGYRNCDALGTEERELAFSIEPCPGDRGVRQPAVR